MAQITITEALAEIKTITARVQKLRAMVPGYLVRDGKMVDPLDREGGSTEHVRRTRQAIDDLSARLVAIRTAIQAKNLSTMLTLGHVTDVRAPMTQSVAAWLAWRKEVAPGQKEFLSALFVHIQNSRVQAQRQGRKVVAADEAPAPENVVVCVNEKQLTDEIDQMEKWLGELDGRLSLHNATTCIDV